MPPGMPWAYPDNQLFQQAAQANPTQAAAAGLTAQQGQQSPTQTSTTPTLRGAPPTGTGLGMGIGSPPGGQTPGTSMQGSNFGVPPGLVSQSPEWFGTGNRFISQAMANDPNFFWQGYGTNQMGLSPDSFMNAFLGQNYNTMALGQTLFGSPFQGEQNQLQGMNQLSNLVTGGPRINFFDPATLVSQTLQAIATANPMQPGGAHPALKNIALADPISQISLTIDFLREVLAAAMPPDALNAFITQLSALGNHWFTRLQGMSNEQIGGSGRPGGANFAQFLIQTLGPTLGL